MDNDVRKGLIEFERLMIVYLKMLQHFPQLRLNHQETVNRHRTASRTRLVWYVGISGYILLNAKLLWDAIAQREMVGINVLWLSLPWLICVFLGSVTYFLLDELSRKQDNLFWGINADISTRLIAIESDLDYFRESINNESSSSNPIDISNLVQQMKKDEDLLKEISTIDNEHPDYAASAKVVDKLSSWESFFEKATFIFLVIGFIWIIVGPLMFS